jgi:multiple sugar transport system substrate-binding protein
LRQWKAQIYSADGTRCLLDSTEAIAAVQYMRDLVWVHHVTPTPAEASALPSGGGYGSGKINVFGSGQAAMALAGRWWLPVLRTNFQTLEFGVSECQFGPARQYRAYCAVTAVNKFSKHRDEALAFLLYMASPEYNNLINSQADSMGPVRKYAQSASFLTSSDFPDEAYNPVWIETMDRSVPDEVSPFVNGAAANRIITRQLDLVANNLKSPQEAMQTAAQLINEEIAQTVEGDPKLRKLYNERTGR